MFLFATLAILITLTALFAFINQRYIGLPTTIGVMVVALGASMALLVLGALGVGDITADTREMLNGIDFSTALLKGMLSFLLFAGALHVNLNDLSKQGWVIGTLATVGVVFSTVLVAVMTYYVTGWAGLELPFIYCLIFGALISPTDPIAVLAILKSAGVAKTLQTKVTGESLFNDGIGVVIFLVLLEFASGHTEITAGAVSMLLLQEAVGGALFGLGLGYVAFLMLRRIEDYQTEILITLAVVTGGYALASALHMSGPIAIVVAGLLIGNQGRMLAMNDKTREHLDTFWELIDELLNAVLFMLIGLEILVVPFDPSVVVFALIAVPLVLLARFVAVGSVVRLLSLKRDFTRGAIRVLTWGGLRGGISVALALALPAGPERDVILQATYAVVLFSIIVQGLTIKKLVRRVGAVEITTEAQHA